MNLKLYTIGMPIFDTKPLVKLIQPSQLSMMVCSLTGLVVVGVLLFGLLSKNDIYQQYILSLEESPSGIYGGYEQAKDQINSSKIAADSSVFLVWAIVGMVAYYIVVGLVAVATGVYSFLDHLRYKGINKKSLLHDALLGLLIRIVAAVVLIFLLRLVISEVVPRVIAMFSGIDTFSVQMLVPLGVTFVACVVLVHTAIVLARLFLLRTRVFYSANYISS